MRSGTGARVRDACLWVAVVVAVFVVCGAGSGGVSATSSKSAINFPTHLLSSSSSAPADIDVIVL